MPGFFTFSIFSAVSRPIGLAIACSPFCIEYMIHNLIHNIRADCGEGWRTGKEERYPRQCLWIRGFLVYGEARRRTANGATGGRGGIRTHETLAGLPVFKTGAFN